MNFLLKANVMKILKSNTDLKYTMQNFYGVKFNNGYYYFYYK